MTWLLPVPVRQTKWQPTFAAANAHFGVLVDASRAQTTSAARNGTDDADVAYADWQLNLHWQQGTLGSGRAVYYRGKFLKGVGNTPLRVMRTPDPTAYHSTGHLLPSGAIRERLIATYLSVHGLQHARLDVDDVLFSRNDQTRQDAAVHIAACLQGAKDGRNSVRAKEAAALPIDTHLSAITVKSGDFLRYTNLLWLLANAPNAAGKNGLDEFVSRLGMFSSPSIEGTRRAVNDAESAFAAFAQSIERTFLSLLQTNALGVRWGSLNNNFALDGRYVDLETPMVLGRMLVGAWHGSRRRDHDVALLARSFECYAYISQMRMFVFEVQRRLLALLARARTERATSPSANRVERTLGTFKRVIAQSVLYRDADLHRAVLDVAMANVAMRGDQRKAVAALFRQLQGAALDPPEAGSQMLDCTPLRGVFLAPEYHPSRRKFVVPSIMAADASAGHDASVFQHAFEHVVAAKTATQATHRLREADQMLRMRITPRVIAMPVAIRWRAK